MIFITFICHGCEVKLKNINMEKVFTFNFCSSNAYEI